MAPPRKGRASPAAGGTDRLRKITELFPVLSTVAKRPSTGASLSPTRPPCNASAHAGDRSPARAGDAPLGPPDEGDPTSPAVDYSFGRLARNTSSRPLPAARLEKLARATAKPLRDAGADVGNALAPVRAGLGAQVVECLAPDGKPKGGSTLRALIDAQLRARDAAARDSAERAECCLAPPDLPRVGEAQRGRRDAARPALRGAPREASCTLASVLEMISMDAAQPSTCADPATDGNAPGETTGGAEWTGSGDEGTRASAAAQTVLRPGACGATAFLPHALAPAPHRMLSAPLDCAADNDTAVDTAIALPANFAPGAHAGAVAGADTAARARAPLRELDASSRVPSLPRTHDGTARICAPPPSPAALSGAQPAGDELPPHGLPHAMPAQRRAEALGAARIAPQPPPPPQPQPPWSRAPPPLPRAPEAVHRAEAWRGPGRTPAESTHDGAAEGPCAPQDAARAAAAELAALAALWGAARDSTSALEAAASSAAACGSLGRFAPGGLTGVVLDVLDELARTAGADGFAAPPAAQLRLRVLANLPDTPDPSRGAPTPDAPAACAPSASPARSARACVHVCLRGSWLGTAVRAGDSVSIVLTAQPGDGGGEVGSMGWFERRGTGPIIIDDAQNWLVLRPCELVSGTELSDSYACARRVVLGRTHACADGSAVPLIGTLRHALFERLALSSSAAQRDAAAPCASSTESTPRRAAPPHAPNAAERAALDALIAEIVRAHRAELLAAGLAEAGATAALISAAPALLAWLRAHLPSSAREPRALLPLAALGSGLDGCKVALVRPICAELELVSMVLGLKGKVDLVLDAALELPPLPTARAGACVRAAAPPGAGAAERGVLRVPLPFELKTGAHCSDAVQMRHGAQVATYTLMLSEQLGVPVPAGALCYPLAPAPPPPGRSGGGGAAAAAAAAATAAAAHGAPGATLAVRAPRLHALHLLHARNSLAAHLRAAPQRPPLPPMLRVEAACARCAMRAPCMLAHALLEGGDAHSSGASRTFDAETRAVRASPALREYVREAGALVDVEQAHEVRAPPASVWLERGVRVELGGAAPAPPLDGETRGDATTPRARDAGEMGAVDGAGEGAGEAPARAPLVLGALEVAGGGPGLGARADEPTDGERARARERHVLRLRRATDCPPALALRPLDAPTIDGRSLCAGESVRLSLEPRRGAARLPAEPHARARYGVACGTIVHISPTELAIALEQPFEPIPHAAPCDALAGASRDAAGDWGAAYWVRVDALVGTRLYATQRSNLAWLASSDEPIAARLRELIVTLAPPRFAPDPMQSQPQPPQPWPRDGAATVADGPAEGCERARAPLAGLSARVAHGATPGGAADAPCDGGGGGSCVDGGVAAALRALAADDSLTAEQRAAARACARARDYAIVLGVPGAGKSCLIAALVRALASAGLRVLVAANAHAALDHILRKLRDDGNGGARGGGEGAPPPFVRVGPASRAHADTRACALDALLAAAPLGGGAALVARARVFGATVQSCAHGALRAVAPFDVAIIDEAGQVAQPALLGVLRLARRFVLVGDHFQLPPVLRERGVRGDGGARAGATLDTGGADDTRAPGSLAESMMARLARAHPAAVSALRLQWRMCSEVMSVPNALFYAHLLRAGSDAVGARRLALDARALGALGGADRAWAWARAALDPAQPVVVCDSDALARVHGGPRTAGGTTHEAEARVALALAACALRAGLAPSAIAVISPYRAQLRRVRELLDSACSDGSDGAHSALPTVSEGALAAQLRAVDALTIDQSQGQDRACVIVSLAKHNAHGNVGALLADWRRLNVALTRAQCKLIVLGSRSTLTRAAVPAALFELARARGWLLEPPPDAATLGASRGVSAVESVLPLQDRTR